MKALMIFLVIVSAGFLCWLWFKIQQMALRGNAFALIAFGILFLLMKGNGLLDRAMEQWHRKHFFFAFVNSMAFLVVVLVAVGAVCLGVLAKRK
jgi:hypothetical protein